MLAGASAEAPFDAGAFTAGLMSVSALPLSILSALASASLLHVAGVRNARTRTETARSELATFSARFVAQIARSSRLSEWFEQSAAAAK